MTVDAGPLPVDAGPPRVVDGGLVGPFSRGTVTLSQRVREDVTRTVVTATVSATFVDVAAQTPNPCVERAEGACMVRIGNQGSAIIGTFASAGTLTFDGLLPREQPDSGVVDAGLFDGGWALAPNDAGLVSESVTQRLFFGGSELVVHAEGATVPPFTSPLLTTPAQLTVSTPRCVPTCAPISRSTPFRVSWSGVSNAEAEVRLSTAQVTVTCRAPAEQNALEVPATLLQELTPSATPGEATLTMLARTSVSLDAGSWNVVFSAETPTLLPVTVLP